MLGNDQSPLAGQSAITSIPVRSARHGRSSSTTNFTASLTAYAATVPTPVSTVPATRRTSRRRIAVHHIATSSTPRSTRVPSVATSSAGPNHDGAPAAAPMTALYPDTETPSVTCTAPARPNPPGESQASVAATAAKTPTAANNRPAPLVARVSRFMGVDRRNESSRKPEPNGKRAPPTIVRLTTPQRTTQRAESDGGVHEQASRRSVRPLRDAVTAARATRPHSVSHHRKGPPRCP